MKLQKQGIPFTQVANDILKSDRLSWKAKGLYAYLFSKPDGWNFSADRIKTESSDGRHSVLAALKELEKHGCLERKKQGNGRVDYFLKHSTLSQETELRVGDPKSGFRTVRKPHSAKIDTISNKEGLNKIEEESNIEAPAKTSGAEVAEFIDAFKEVNPSHARLFGNKTQRAASERLVKKYGFEKCLGMASYLTSIAGKPYAPSITTPYELEAKLGKLVEYARKQKTRGSKLVVV